MAIMRGGGSATDAVEIAIKILEDREITNAGYGSNLAMDGVVECDAVIVDHHGRSGACGAVARKPGPPCHSCISLTIRRDQEPHISCKADPQSHNKSAQPPPRATQSSRRSGSH